LILTDYAKAAEMYKTKAIAGGGIYLANKPLLNFINGNNTLTLSEMPVFSEEVVFSPNAIFDYSIYVRVDPNWINNEGDHIGGGGERTNNLSTDSVQSTVAAIKEGVFNNYSHMISGNMPIFGNAYSLLVYENNEWIVAVAQSEDVIVSF
jgi:hypothetical protein